jgi:hypothetical protein
MHTFKVIEVTNISYVTVVEIGQQLVLLLHVPGITPVSLS